MSLKHIYAAIGWVGVAVNVMCAIIEVGAHNFPAATMSITSALWALQYLTIVYSYVPES